MKKETLSQEAKIIRSRRIALTLGVLAALALLAAGSSGALAQSKKGSDTPQAPMANQTIYSFPMTITVQDDTSMNIKYTNQALNQNESQQFFGGTAEGVYLWVNVGGETKVFGPEHVPAGRTVNPYQFVSNTLSGIGSASDPYLVTTVADVPGTNLRLTQTTKYVNGAEFVGLKFQLAQIGGSAPVTATLFHAADLYTAGSDSGYGFYDSSTGGAGDYYTPTTRALYQQFVPSNPASHYMESYYGTIWGAIGSTSGPGSGFDDTVITSTLHDAATGLQWDLNIPQNSNVIVGDTDLFSPHAALCGSFSDVHYGDFYYEYIYYLACHGIVSGYSDTTFRPQNNVSRGQLCKIVANSAGFNEPPSGQLFEDIPPDSTFYPYIQRMATRNIIGGYPCGGPGEPCVAPDNRPYFRSNANASRGQISKIVANAANLNGTPTSQTYHDVLPGDPFYVFIERLTARGTMGGYQCGGPGEPCDGANRPYFRPASNATRAQTSKIDALTFFPTCCPAGPVQR